MSKKKLISTLVILSCISLMLIVTPQVKGVQFYIAGWSQDEYGQGPESYYLQSNRTGSWVTIEYGSWDDDPGAVFPVRWNISQVMKITLYSTMNSTLLGLTNTTDLILGQNYIKHNITVTDQWGAEVFSQQNFTCDYNETYGDLFWYRHYVILNFLPLEGEFYTVTIRTQIYW